MPLNSRITRRDVLKAATAAAVPLVLPGRLFGADAPSKKITLASIGIGWQGGGNLGNFLGNADCRVLAVRDVDAEPPEAGGRTASTSSYDNKDCKAYKDFRDVLARSGYRRRLHLHARPLALDSGDRGRQCEEGHLLREAALAHAGRRHRHGRGGRAQRPHLADRLLAAERAQLPLGGRHRGQRLHRQGQARRGRAALGPCRLRQDRRQAARLRSAGKASITTSGSARRR